MILTRDKGMRMWGGAGGVGGGGGGLNASALAGFATQAWVDTNYVGIPFFNELFTIHGKEVVTVTDGTTGEETTTITERDLLPNEVPGTVSTTDEETGGVTTTVVSIESIEAKAGFWTNFFVSALGLNSDGGGSGGATALAGLTDVQLTTPISNGQALVYDSNLGKWKNATIEGGGGGTGTVTSVALSVPTGFRVTGSPVTTSGTLAIAFATGYSLPTTAKQANWDIAFSNTHTHANQTVLDGITATKVADWDDAVQGLSSISGRVSTLEDYFTSGVANSAARLSGTASRTVWGQTYWQNGVPKSVTGALTSVTDITMSGKITIGGFVIEVVDGDLKFNGNIYATGGVSALGQDSQGSSLVLTEPLATINSANLGTPSASGQTLVWNGSRWTYGTGGGGGTGTVTSVAMTVPTGFTISGSPITGSGTLALAFATGYSLPTTDKQANWDTAFSNTHTHANQTVLDGITATKVADWDDAVQGLSTVADRVSTLEGYFTGGVANSAARLSGTASRTVWGQTYWQNGVPKNVTGALTSVTDITMSGKITIGGFVIEVVNGDLKFNGNIYATGGVSALGSADWATQPPIPTPTSSDAGKVLTVSSSGAYTLTSAQTYYTGTTTPSSTMGQDGDLYFQTA